LPKRTNEFQQLVFRIYQALSTGHATARESVLLKEKNSDAEREIDVLMTSAIAGHEVKIAVECRDHANVQDITWVDSLIGKYANLDVHKVIAVSHTSFSATAYQKARQHNIELLTFKEAEQTDWQSKVGPAAFRFFAYRNRPLIVGLRLRGNEQAKFEYDFEGAIKSASPSLIPAAKYFLEGWQMHMAPIAGEKLGKHVFENWETIKNLPQTPRYWEITEALSAPHTLSFGESRIEFDEVVWGIGTKFAAESPELNTWAVGDKAALIASSMNDEGKPVHVTLVTEKTGQLTGISVKTESP